MVGSAPAELVGEVAAALRALTTEIDGLDQRAAQLLGLHRTDLRCLDVISSRGPLMASEVGHAVGLTSGGTSIALERLERGGLVRRSHGAADRRKVLVEVTALTRRREEEVFGPLQGAVARMLAGYSVAKLRAVRGFLEDLRAVMAAQATSAVDVEAVSGG